MLSIWLMLTAIAGLLIYTGSKLCDIGYRQYGSLLMIIGCFQLLAEFIVIL